MSASKEYASFIRNSRPRSRPKRGRSSSRYFQLIWYRFTGRSRYDVYSCATIVVMTSSAVGRQAEAGLLAVEEAEHQRAVRRRRARTAARARAAGGSGARSPARRRDPSPRGRSARPCAAPGIRAAATSRCRPRSGGCSRRGRAAGGCRPRRRPDRHARCVGRARTSASLDRTQGVRSPVARFPVGIPGWDSRFNPPACAAAGKATAHAPGGRSGFDLYCDP